MANRLIKHGTQAGYKAHLNNDDMCERCRNASRVYFSQFTKAGKAKGIKYSTHEVIDQLYKPNQPRGRRPNYQPSQVRPAGAPEPSRSADTGQDETQPQASSESQPETSLRDRLSGALFSLRAERRQDEYVNTDEPPDYIRPIDPDPEPASDDWARVQPDEFLVTAEGIKDIKDNLASYLVTIGMTLELIDPYCGGVLRSNVDDMIESWTRVISLYPGAAKMFMAKGGGKIMAWIDALIATWPILLAIYEHHLSRTVQLDSLGRVIRVNNSNGQAPPPDFATAPQYNYTVD